MAAFGGLVKGALSSAAARTFALGSLQARAESAVRSATTPAAERITWDAKDWPHPRAGLVHWDVAELRTKRPSEHALARQLQRWALAVCAVGAVNLLDSIVLATIIRGGAYEPLAPLYALLTLTSIGGGALATAWAWYHGVAESAGRSKTAARVGLGVVTLAVSLFAISASGNLNGVVGFAQSSRVASAVAGGSGGGAIGFWHAVMAIESLAWLSCGAAGGYLAWRTTQPAVAPPVAAAAPAAPA